MGEGTAGRLDDLHMGGRKREQSPGTRQSGEAGPEDGAELARSRGHSARLGAGTLRRRVYRQRLPADGTARRANDEPGAAVGPAAGPDCVEGAEARPSSARV